MGKINRYANIYDKEGNLLRHVNEDGYLEDMTIEEVEELVDKLAEDKDENGNVKDPQALNNTNAILFQMYQKYGNPHEAELINRIKEAQKTKTTEEQVKEKLEEIEQEITPEMKQAADDAVEMEKYIDFEEIAA